MVTIDESVASSTYSEIPFTTGNSKSQGLGEIFEGILMQWISIYGSSSNQMLPTHMYANIHTIFNDQFQV